MFIHHTAGAGSGETFASAHAYVEVGLQDGSSVEFPINIDARISAEELLDALGECETECELAACLLRFATNDRLPEADVPEADMQEFTVASPAIGAPLHMENTRLTEREATQSARLLRDVFGGDDGPHPHLKLMR